MTHYAHGNDMCNFLMLAEAARDKLPPPTRAAAIMAIIGIALLGMLLVVIILLGGHWVRRQGSYRRGQAVPPDRRPILTGVTPETSDSQPERVQNDDATIDAAETAITRDTRKLEKPST